MRDINRVRGMFYGLAVGDALGTTLEFKERDSYDHITDMVGGGPFRLAPGEWTDDTSMALALAQTLIEHGMDQIELLKNFTRWYNYGEFSHNGRCFDIGHTTRMGINQFILSEGRRGDCGSERHDDSGNGGIMRLSPVVVYALNKDEAVGYAMAQSATTHASQLCISYAALLADRLWDYSTGLAPADLVDIADYFATPREKVQSSGFVEHTFQAAEWAVYTTTNFEEALLRAVNLGDDADTVGAVAGQLAGAIYGYDGIPPHWLAKLAWKERFDEMFEQLYREEIHESV